VWWETGFSPRWREPNCSIPQLFLAFSATRKFTICPSDPREKDEVGLAKKANDCSARRKGPERAAALSLWLYSVVWLWYLLQKSNQRTFIVPPWNPLKTMPSFADAIGCLRRELWRERIKRMFGVSAVHDKKFEFLLEALAPAG